MKKLMIMAAVALAAVCSQAAAAKTYYWNVVNGDGSTLYLPSSSTPLASGMLYILGADAGSADEVWNSILAGDSTFEDYTADALYEASVVNGVVQAETDAFETSSTKAKHAFTYLLKDGDNYFVAADELTGVTLPAGQDIEFALSYSGLEDVNFGKVEFTDNGWYTTADVPEPTSGLLLLLGVAGLALRRRRA